MARIAGVDLPRDKRIEIGLTYIYGIGLKSSKDILAATGIDPDLRVKDLTEDGRGSCANCGYPSAGTAASAGLFL